MSRAKRVERAELSALVDELSVVNRKLTQAYMTFNTITEPALVDSCVYEINAQLAKYDYLIRRVKERGGQRSYDGRMTM